MLGERLSSVEVLRERELPFVGGLWLFVEAFEGLWGVAIGIVTDEGGRGAGAEATAVDMTADLE